MSHALRSVLLLWAGIAIGVSLIATPAKFLAADLSLPVALQVGRVTFQVVGVVEAVLAVIAIGIALCARQRRALILAPAVAMMLLVLQHAVLLPAIAAFTDQVMAGESEGGSMLHTVYVAVECLKIAWLVLFGIRRVPKASA